MADPRDENVMLYRMAELEREVRGFNDKLERAVGTLGGNFTALQSQLISYQKDLPKDYMPRGEGDERHQAIIQWFRSLDNKLDERGRISDERINDNQRRIERMEAAAWAFAIGILGSLATAAAALLKH